ncbi:succinate dehydrogenase, putative, partial [Perkinsus marinus ATCC 50983]
MSGTFTLEQVKKHDKPDDCWIVVNGDVIDCTKYLPNHPGGSLAITAFAGCDCSLEFNTVHDKSMMEQYRDLIIGKVSDGITMEEVARHGTPNDCWIVVNGEVLDVTDYIKEHPGGELSITAFGGTDCSLEYNTVHAKALIQETCPQCVIGKLLVPKKRKKSKAKAKGVLDMDEVARHNTKEDCWVVVNGFVLAVTPFLPEHPGGPEAILKYAGKDATEEWNMIHSFDVLKQYGGKYIVGKLGDPLGGTADLGLTVEEVARHNTKQDCWVIINGTVFNLTDWLPLHPGGESVILNYAGKDASDEWNAIHPSGTME